MEGIYFANLMQSLKRVGVNSVDFSSVMSALMREGSGEEKIDLISYFRLVLLRGIPSSYWDIYLL